MNIRTYNEIYTPFIEKQKIIDPCERSIYKLVEQYSTTDKGKTKSYKATKKAHATRFKNFFQLMYLEQIFFAVVRAGRKITKIYSHYTFEQERFKKDFILMNQKSRQNAKNSVEKDFYKLMNNSNLGYDCRNNLDNCKFVPIFEELKEIMYIKKYINFFYPKVSKFVMPDLIAQEIEEKYNDDIIKIFTEDKFYKLKKSAADTEKAQALESLKEFDKKEQDKNKRQKKKKKHFIFIFIGKKKPVKTIK